MAAPPLLILPEAIWQTTVELLEPYTRAQVECGLYRYGLRSPGRGPGCRRTNL